MLKEADPQVYEKVLEKEPLSTRLKVPPPPDVVAWASQDLGANVQPLTSDEWVELLEGAGLKEIIEITSVINTKEEARGILGRYGWGGMIRVMWRMFSLYFSNPAYKKFVKSVQEEGVTPKGLEEYFGYGVYVGRKLT
ncbi:MAG: hypothetical protein WBB64_03920 [Anaerolineales bacterium]